MGNAVSLNYAKALYEEFSYFLSEHSYGLNAYDTSYYWEIDTTVVYRQQGGEDDESTYRWALTQLVKRFSDCWFSFWSELASPEQFLPFLA